MKKEEYNLERKYSNYDTNKDPVFYVYFLFLVIIIASAFVCRL